MKIAINGCGIAGPTLAWWLRRYGFEPVLFEKAPCLRTGGYILDFWGLGYDIAEKMGLLPKILDLGYRVERFSIVDERGREITGLESSVFRSLTGGRYVSLPRGDLASTIFHACEGVEVRFGVSVDRVMVDSEHVRVRLSDGSEEPFDLVVGADGLHSHVRRLAFGPEPDFEKDLGYYACAFALPDYPHRDELTYVSHTLPQRQMARFSLRDGSTLFFLVFRAELLERFPADEREVRRVLREVYGEMKWEAPEVLEGIDESVGIYFDRVSQIQMTRWAAERVALVGDAAACPSLLAGEGSGLGMVEAYVLAGELRQAEGCHKTAFIRYQEKLQPFLSRKQSAATKNAAFFAPGSRLGIRLRDFGTRLCSIPLLANLMLGSSLKDDFELPDYPTPGSCGEE